MNNVVNKNRLQNRLIELAEIGKQQHGGITRLALTDEDRQAQSIVSSWMQEAGMKVTRDHFGNLIGRKEGTAQQVPSIIMGSHIDTVPHGGQFDGTIGVLGAIEVVQTIHEQKIQHNHPLEVIVFNDEEGSRFSSGLFGSRGIAGEIEEADLMKKDMNHITRYDAMKAFGLHPENREQSIRRREDIQFFLEMHIEQGPFLQSVDRPIGIVTGISGVNWFTLKLKGEAGHAGTVPMNLRKDPMVGASEIISHLEKVCLVKNNNETVGTVGKIHASPGGLNVIPNCVEFTLDIRDISYERRNNVICEMISKIEEVCHRRKLEYELKENLNLKSVHCSDVVVQQIDLACRKLNLDVPKMVSGASHDTMVMEKITDVGMIFVRCRDGISHNPKEWAEIDDIVVGTLVMLETIINFEKEKGGF